LAIDGSGGADDRIDLGSACQNPVGPGGYVDTKPGVTAGAIRQGMNTLFDDYASGMDPADFPPDTNIKEGITYAQYLAGLPANSQPPSHDGVAGRRVVLLPITTMSQVENGRTTVQIDHSVAFFLRSNVSGGSGLNIEAEYIDISVVVGDGVYDLSRRLIPVRQLSTGALPIRRHLCLQNVFGKYLLSSETSAALQLAELAIVCQSWLCCSPRPPSLAATSMNTRRLQKGTRVAVRYLATKITNGDCDAAAKNLVCLWKLCRHGQSHSYWLGNQQRRDYSPR